jgi:hypothetical protein
MDSIIKDETINIIIDSMEIKNNLKNNNNNEIIFGIKEEMDNKLMYLKI